MTITIELGNGQTAQFREPATLTNGQRRPIVNASNRYLKTQIDPILSRELQRAVAQKDKERQTELLTALSIGQDDSAPLKVGEVVITVLVESWTLTLPVPSEKPILNDDGELVGSEVLDDISAWDYDRLQRAAGELLPSLRWIETPAGKAPAERTAKRPSSPRSKKR